MTFPYIDFVVFSFTLALFCLLHLWVSALLHILFILYEACFSAAAAQRSLCGFLSPPSHLSPSLHVETPTHFLLFPGAEVFKVKLPLTDSFFVLCSSQLIFPPLHSQTNDLPFFPLSFCNLLKSAIYLTDVALGARVFLCFCSTQEWTVDWKAFF